MSSSIESLRILLFTLPSLCAACVLTRLNEQALAFSTPSVLRGRRLGAAKALSILQAAIPNRVDLRNFLRSQGVGLGPADNRVLKHVYPQKWPYLAAFLIDIGASVYRQLGDNIEHGGSLSVVKLLHAGELPNQFADYAMDVPPSPED
ncbi:hypothetical protein BDK51DRAFT_51159 [Blyttiomyces helicus]|uniref:Uncharacterized protein n=1 Tax=Blyttiomyces helicus TaxID=388810 RepID=A0A4P9WRL4_9FUNG|nr:hypothetical protein BDK51DRAFT_51159 [Blyttiomyces helicus]|eukprot:RKO94823.1 hypothetical protein BDK51DRAFT_51159 [Blyttiomyces helicus]